MSDSAGEQKSGHNLAEYSVSEISAHLKREIESLFPRVRVRGEISQPSFPRSGHCYFRLKDENAVLDAVCWKGVLPRLAIRPEEGMEVIATGRITTFAGSSRYQIVIDQLELAGQGALLKLLEERRRKLAAEGLFAAERKRALPYLPEVIGVVTSPTGAVIRDILHRLADRFPRHVLVWPVAVQGERAAGEVARAIRGFNELPEDGPVPRPDLLIVARGGGSLEDLWAFNEEIVVRAAADSTIPLISAVGHETDTTLIDFAADRRAPTPTAAAEMAVPVRAELHAGILDQARRLVSGMGRELGEVRYTVARVPSFAQGIECLIASKRGLYVLQHGALDLILPGEFYGATRRGEDWYVFQKLATTGRLIRLRVDDSRVVVAARIGPTLSEGCHQIDMVDGALYVTDTYNNRLLVLRVGAGGASIQRKLTPFGDLRQGRQSENYVHLNSIWRNARGLYAVLHNETSKTGRNSEIAVLSTSGEVIERRATPASHAHNVLEFRGKALYCDSKHASLRWGDDVVFKCEHFTRGLAVTPDHVLVGGSEYGARETRSRLGGKLFVLSHDFRLLGAIPLPGSVHEVRGLGADLGLSAPLR